MRSLLIVSAFTLAAAPPALSRMPQSAARAFDAYIAAANLPSHPAALASKTDALFMEPVNGGSWPVDGGRMHHWRGAIAVPRATAGDMFALLTDYDHFHEYYNPDVVASKALRNSGASVRVSMRFKKHRVITVVLDAEFEQRTVLVDGGRRGYSTSRSIHIWQVDHPGTPQERRRAEGDDEGFLWRLSSYWSFQETSAALLVECDAVSLTRDVPPGLGWLVVPIIQSLPRDSLTFTLLATRKALLNRRAENGRAN